MLPRANFLEGDKVGAMFFDHLAQGIFSRGKRIVGVFMTEITHGIKRHDAEIQSVTLGVKEK